MDNYNWYDLERINRIAPAVFTKFPHARMSGNYAFTNTYDIIDYIIRRGFSVQEIQQTGRSMFGKVLVKLQPNEYTSDNHPQLIVIDSHDGTSALKIMLGYYRFVCSNGLIVGPSLFSETLRHNTHDVQAKALLALVDAREAMINLAGKVGRMDRIILSKEEIEHFGIRVADLRFPNMRSREVEVVGRQLVKYVRREEDLGNNLYRVLNRAQENATSQGMRYLFEGQVKSVRSLTQIDANVRFNTKLWELGEEFCERSTT
jgi:hypothetical protein